MPETDLAEACMDKETQQEHYQAKEEWVLWVNKTQTETAIDKVQEDKKSSFNKQPTLNQTAWFSSRHKKR